MTYESFRKLVDKISPFMPVGDFSQAKVNGPISIDTRVAVSLRYFAGRSPLDIAPLYGIAVNEVLRSVWRVVDAVNNYPKFRIEYPSCHEEQKRIARKFREKSGADFQCCAGERE